MNTTETIKSNLRRIRIAQNLTQEEAAFRCGISTRHYSTIENGEVNMSVSTLDKICDSLNVTPYSINIKQGNRPTQERKATDTTITDP